MPALERLAERGIRLPSMSCISLITESAEAAFLAVVYKIAGRFEGKLWLVRCLEEASVYDLT